MILNPDGNTVEATLMLRGHAVSLVDENTLGKARLRKALKKVTIRRNRVFSDSWARRKHPICEDTLKRKKQLPATA